MSIVPWKRAPSAIASFGVVRRPLEGGHSSGDRAQDDHRPGDNLRLDAGADANRQDVARQIDSALDLSIEDKILAGLHLAFDDH